MRVGAFYFPTDYGINMAELARALEDRGFDSLFVPEHTHIPASRKSPFPGGGELPKRYSHTHDPFVALAFAAAATKKLKLGTGILLVPQHEPIVTAKAIASLDQLSGGRFIFGIGGGWNVEEMENHGAKYQTRFKQMREHVLAMKELWTKEEASFDGEFVKFDRVWSWPKPAQQPHPPIILGGETDHTLRRVIEYCDGWFPRPRGGFDVVKGRGASAPDGGEGGPRPVDDHHHRVRLGQRRQGAGELRQGRHPERAAGDPGRAAATRSCAISTRSRRSPRWRWRHDRRHRPRPDGVPLRRGERLLALGRSLRGGRCRFAVADRPAGEPPADPGMHGGDGGAGRPHAPPALRHERRVAGAARSGASSQAVRHHRRAVRGPAAAGFGIGSPLGPEWEALDIDTKTRGRRTDESLQIIARLWREDSVDFEGRHYRLKAASISPKPVQPDLPMWIGGSSEAAIRRTARYGTGWQSGAEQPDAVGKVVAAIKKAAAEAGRTIDEDHYGAAFPFYFGSPGDGVLSAAMAAYQKRTGRDPSGYFAIGDEKVILDRVAEYVAVGVEKFILRPVGPDGDAIIAQTRKLIDKVLPQVEARWPKKAKAA